MKMKMKLGMKHQIHFVATLKNYFRTKMRIVYRTGSENLHGFQYANPGTETREHREKKANINRY